MTTKNREYLSSSKYTKTSALLLHSVGVNPSLILSYGFVNAYLRDYSRSDDPKYCLYLLFDYKGIEAFEDFANVIRNLDNFYDEYDPEENKVMFVLKVIPKWNEVVDKFKIGKYSQIPREYVNTYFTPRSYHGLDQYGVPVWKPSKNYQILTADPELKQQIEEDLKVTLAPDAEVFSKPNIFEIYGVRNVDSERD